MCDVSSCTTLSVCHDRPLLRSWCVHIYLQSNVIQQVSLCADQAKCVDIHFRRETNQTVRRAQRRKSATLQVRLQVLWCVGAGIVECLKGWRCVVGGVEVCGRGGGVWEGLRCVVGGVRCVVGGVMCMVGGVRRVVGGVRCVVGGVRRVVGGVRCVVGGVRRVVGGVRCVVGGVRRVVGGVRCVVGGVRRVVGGIRCVVGGVEMCGGRDKVCGGRGGDV